MEHRSLKKIQKSLSNYFSYFKHDNILVVSEDKAVAPFAFIIIENNQLLLSLAVDYPHSYNVAELTILINKVKPVELAEQFFITQTGHTYIGEQAHYLYDLERHLPIDDIEPASDTIH